MKKREFIKTITATGCGLACINPFIAAESENSSDELWKWSILAAYQQETPRGIRCMICPNECTLKPGEISDCRNRVNHKGKLYSIAYGNPCSVHVDPIEKKPLNHFLPSSKAFSIATAGCNMACMNCQNWQISQKSPKETRNYNLMPEEVVKKALEYNCKSIAYTYTEPITFYEYVRDSSQLARKSGIKNVMVSNGFIKEEPCRELCKYIDAANIDLKSFSDEIYLKLTGGNLEPVLNTLKTMKEENVWLEITNLIVPSWTDDLDMIKKMCNWLSDNEFHNTPLHFSRFHPQHKLTSLPATPVSVLESAYKIAKDAGLNYVYIGNVPGNNASDTVCPSCSNIVIERTGYRITKNEIRNGKCSACGETIAGIWN